MLLPVRVMKKVPMHYEIAVSRRRGFGLFGSKHSIFNQKEDQKWLNLAAIVSCSERA
jgi:hypothetical protein